MGILIEEEHVQVLDDERRYGMGSSGVYESFADTPGELYRALQKEYGRCTSYVYVGDENPIKIGWVFQRREKYTDCDDTYTHEVWVTLHEKEPIKTVEKFPMAI